MLRTFNGQSTLTNKDGFQASSYAVDFLQVRFHHGNTSHILWEFHLGHAYLSSRSLEPFFAVWKVLTQRRISRRVQNFISKLTWAQSQQFFVLRKFYVAFPGYNAIKSRLGLTGKWHRPLLVDVLCFFFFSFLRLFKFMAAFSPYF